MGTMGEPVLKLAAVKCFKMSGSSRLSRLSPNNKDPESEPENNSSSMSSSDSEAELEVLIYMWQNGAGWLMGLGQND
nr:hypothetical protein [Tanacetum cinerariifolium]